MAEIFQFPFKEHPISPLAQFIRLGEGAYRRTASLFAEGHLKAKRVVVDASVIRFLKDQLLYFRQAGIEVVLDTKAAELAANAKFNSLMKKVPWVPEALDKPLGPIFFGRERVNDLCGRIARLAVENDVDAVLSPSHFLNDPTFDGWMNLDREACVQLRYALDRAGGQSIAIDYLLVLSHLQLNDPEYRLKLVLDLADLPFDNLWVRASGFGNDVGAQPAAQFIDALAQLHNLGKPVIVDYLGGLIGEAAMAMGAVSGIAHGVGEVQRFNARQWHNLPKKRDDGNSGGRARRVSLASINKSLLIKEFETLLSAQNSKRLLWPQLGDGSGVKTVEDVLNEPKIVAARESVSCFEALNDTPNLHRATYFMQNRMEPAVELSKQIKNLIPREDVAKSRGVDTESLMKRMSEHSKTLARQSNAFAKLKEKLHEQGASVRPIQRLARIELSAQGKRL